jgi:DNA-binding transcriptional MerR regulator
VDRTGHAPAAAWDGRDAVMGIGEVARGFGVSERALRFYESKRLLSPQREGKTRLYRRSDCERLALILRGRRLGFTLTEIRELIAPKDGAGVALELTRAKCIEQISLLERQKRDMEAAIAELRQMYTALYMVEIAAPGP